MKNQKLTIGQKDENRERDRVISLKKNKNIIIFFNLSVLDI